MIYENWTRTIRDDATVALEGLFTDTSSIYDEDIRIFVERLRNAKERMKRQNEDEADFWERYFELKTIGLCEFDLENNYGVRLE